MIHDSHIPVFIHITAGTVGILTGFLAMFLRKGSPRHRLVGNVFVVSMLVMALVASYMAYVGTEVTPPKISNQLAGLLTCYMVVSAWLVGIRQDRKPGWPEYVLFLVAVGVAAGYILAGRKAALSPDGLNEGFPAGLYYVFGSFAVLGIVGDVRMFILRGIKSVQRLARHLWRMCFALLLAATSLFLGQPQVFPHWMHATYVLFIPSLTIIVTLIYYLVRTLFTKAFKGRFLRPSERAQQEMEMAQAKGSEGAA